MRRGPMIDFLELVAKNPQLSRELGELAGRYGLEFATAESARLSDREIDGSSEPRGPADLALLGDTRQLETIEMQQGQQLEAMQAFSNVMQAYNDATNSIISSTK